MRLSVRGDVKVEILHDHRHPDETSWPKKAKAFFRVLMERRIRGKASVMILNDRSKTLYPRRHASALTGLGISFSYALATA